MKLLLENWRKYLKEDTEPYPYQIYCDMDGVLVDFEKGAVEAINRDIQDETIETKEMLRLRRELGVSGRVGVSLADIDKHTQPRTNVIRATRNYMYKRLGEDVEFWANLPWTDDGQELWSYISQFSPYILTAPMGEGSQTGKRLWVEKNLHPAPEKVFISHEKYEWATTDGRPNVLIDDFSTNTIPWATPRHIEGSDEKMSGFAILHTNFKDTKAALEYIASQAAEKSTS